MALTPAEKQRRYRERNKDRPTPAKQIRELKARVAELEAKLGGVPDPINITIQAIDDTVFHQWEQAMGRKKGPTQ